MSKISTMAREDFWAAADQARRRGKDLAEVLDREGYLLTETRLRQIQADALMMAAELFAETSPHQWTTGKTQADLQRSLSAALFAMAKEARGIK
jgi:hypothetical protein